MGLSNELLSQFAKATKDKSIKKSETIVYGTIVDSNGVKYVQLDGSDILTPMASTTNIESGERVPVMIKNHMAIVTGNLTSPAVRSADLSIAYSELDTNITAVAGLVESKVSQEDFNELNKKVQSNSSEIQQTPTNIKMEVQNQVGEAIDDMSIGGRNLATFEQLSFFNEAGTLTGQLVDRAEGTIYYCRSGKIIVLSEFSGNYDGAAFLNISLAKGEQYTVSFWGSCDVDGTSIAVNIFNSGRGVDMNLGDTILLGPSGGYYTRTFECPQTDTYELRFICFGGHSGIVHIMDVKLEAGNKATDWTPAPEDVDAKIAKSQTATLEITNDSITQNVTTINNRINSVVSYTNAALDEKADSADLDAVESRVSTAEQKITSDAIVSTVRSSTLYQTDLDSKADSSDLDAKVDTTYLVENYSTISQTNDRIKMEVANKTIGATNLAAFGKVGFGNSEGTSTGALEDRSEAHYCRSKKVMRLFTFSGSYNVGQYNDISMASGKTYTVSFWAASAEGTQSLVANIWNYDRGVDTQLGETILVSTSGGYYTRTFTCTTTDTYALRFINFGGHTATIDIMDVKLEEGNTATAWSPHPEEFRSGSNIEITENTVKVISETTFIGVPSSDGETMVAQFDENGVTADVVRANNVAYRYNGPSVVSVNPNATGAEIASGGVFRSLVDACASITGRNLDRDVTINVYGDSYGDVVLKGICGTGTISIIGNSHTLTGSIYMGRNTVDITFWGLNLVATGDVGAYHFGPGWVQWSECNITGNGVSNSYALSMLRHASAFLYGCGFYNAEHLIGAGVSTDLVCNTLKGSGTNFIYGDGANIKWYGSRPAGNERIDHPCLRDPSSLSGLTVDSGTSTGGSSSSGTATYDFLRSDSYHGGWGYFSDADVRQGYITKQIYGTMWFDVAKIRNDLNGKTINQASLRLYMQSGEKCNRKFSGCMKSAGFDCQIRART